MIIIGDSGVGKTSLARRFSTSSFHTNSMCTIGVDFVLRTLHVYEGTVMFQVWDPSESECRITISGSYYRGAMGVVMLYDITNRLSFTNLIAWNEEVLKYSNEDVTVIIVGTKSDLEGRRAVTVEEAQDFAEGLGYMYIEASAKTGMNVDDLFLALAKEVIEKEKARKESGLVNITKRKEQKKKLLCIG